MGCNASSLGGLGSLFAVGSGLALGLILGPGCAASQPPCGTTSACATGMVCMTGKCRNANEVPAPESAQRVTLEPLAISILSSSGPSELHRADIPFGKEALGEMVMLLRFPAPFGDTTEIISAFVVLDPQPGTIPGPAPVKLRIARILEPWAPLDTAWATLPNLSSIESTFLASTWGGRALRLDVTEQVRRWRQRRNDDHGLAVLASPQNPVGSSYSLGLAGGRGPRLDVYLR